MAGVNILFITLDQFRADCLSCAGHPIVRTPNLDRLAQQGVRLARHYSQAAPCGPGRASLYTGTYQLNHRVVANGTPLDRRLDNVAKAAARAGYAPTLFGYTDQAVDPRDVNDRKDPRLFTYEGVLPGFEVGLDFTTHDPSAWIGWLRDLGHQVPDDSEGALAGEPDRPAEHSLSAFHTDVFLDWLGRQDRPWFAHLSQLRPHPPYAAAGAFASLYDPAEVPPPVPAGETRHRLHDGLLASGLAAPTDPAEMARLRAQYFGMISEVDHQLGRIWAALEAARRGRQRQGVEHAGDKLAGRGLILDHAGLDEARTLGDPPRGEIVGVDMGLGPAHVVELGGGLAEQGQRPAGVAPAAEGREHPVGDIGAVRGGQAQLATPDQLAGRVAHGVGEHRAAGQARGDPAPDGGAGLVEGGGVRGLEAQQHLGVLAGQVGLGVGEDVAVEQDHVVAQLLGKSDQPAGLLHLAVHQAPAAASASVLASASAMSRGRVMAASR